MEQIGSKEIFTQQRIIGLFEKNLNYTYVGDWTDRENSNIEESYLQKYLKATQQYSAIEVSSAISQLKRAAGNIATGLYAANKEVYGLLRYGINVIGEASENKKNVHMIDWKNPYANDFYIAEEVTAHEMTHLIERLHNSRFTAILDAHIPNWRVIKDELNEFVV